MKEVNEIRMDCIERKVIIAEKRKKRPHISKEKKACPFCPGNEHLTPAEIYRVPKKNWKVRVIPNKYPALSKDILKEVKKTNCFRALSPFGYHEILIETEKHGTDYYDMKVSDIELALKVTRKRYCELKKIDGISYVSIFKNFGKDAGESIRHSHLQILGTPIFPKRIREKMLNLEKFFETSKNCGICKSIEQEKRDKVRVIYENEDWIAYCPFVSIFPYLFDIVPKRHISDIEELKSRELHTLAKTIKKTFSALKKVLGNLYTYNIVYNNFPRAEFFHFYLSVYPRITEIAGAELFGLYINIKSPEKAAKELRKYI